ncbi:hypothetical protein [Klebsiella pneumoniae]|uniref:hypothetical protein n=1 Tax=Klebsiella pneumoniae TaxID=573 RepID=UPI000E2A8F14|nr:hypothetical protein [Klebsiella pneumoniae]SWL38269.1 phage EaA protein [Klebsiella pneumoniae]
MTDIAELALMKGQKVEAPYYLAECTECGKMYSSSKLIESRNYFDGDADCYCPHCNAEDADIADLGSGEQPAAMAWNYQQARIDALVEAVEKAQQRITQMESRTVTDWIEHDGKWRPESLGLDELVYLKTRKQELKIPYPAGKVKGWMNTGGDMDVMAYKLASPQASTVTVKLPLPRRKTADDYVDDTFEPCDLAAVYNACRLECEVKFKNALTAAGIKVEAE